MYKEAFVLMCVLILNSVATVNAEKYFKDKVTSDIPLYDIGHEFLPDTSKYRIINDLIPSILVLFALYSKKRNQLVNALCIAISMRIMSSYVTILPKSTKSECKFKGGIIGGCHDKMFSGHMTVNILSSIAIAKQFPEYIPILIFINIFAGISTISSRDHYTVDVMIALFLSGLIGSKFII